MAQDRMTVAAGSVASEVLISGRHVPKLQFLIADLLGVVAYITEQTGQDPNPIMESV